MTATPTPALLTLAQAGEVLACSEAKVRRLIHAGELDALHCGRHVRVPQDWLEEYVERLKKAARRQASRSVVDAVREAGRNPWKGGR